MIRLVASLSAVAALTACVSQSTARRGAEQARMESYQQAIAEQAQRQQPAVWFRGDVRHPRVLWKENLTLAEALVAAQYTWTWDPRFISVTRNGVAYPVNPRRLLNGQDNPVLEPDDVIEVRR